MGFFHLIINCDVIELAQRGSGIMDFSGMLLIILSAVVHQCEGITVKEYSRRHGTGGIFFNAVICFFALLFFLLTDKGEFYFPHGLFIYGLVNCVCFALGFYAMYKAVSLGSYANTKLVTSLSGVAAIVYGIVILGEKVGRFTYPAIVLVFLSVFLMNFRRDSSSKFNMKWLFWCIMVIVSNAPIGILKREQQLRFGGKCDNEYMIITLLGASLFLFALSFINERENIPRFFKKGTVYGAVAGLFNGASNLLSLFVYTIVPVSIVSPVSSALALVFSFLLSAFAYKEKFSTMQIFAAVIGTVSVVLFKIT